MPEYLTPGVYVEETSFRSKSIEGVSTSTTAFVGPSRKGPFIDAAIVEVEKQDTPEIITSFGDFERVYGGLEDLTWGANYLAHAVRAYFDNGGARLYVARVTSATGTGGRASSGSVISTADPAEQARFVARFPGDAGNGAIEARLIAAPATKGSMDRAPIGTMLRVGGSNPEQGARLEGSVAPPFFVPNNSELRLTVAGADVLIAFKGQAAEIVADTPLDATVDLDETATPANKKLTVVINGVSQIVTLPTDTPQAPIVRERLVDAINRQIVGGYARLTGAADGPANRLVIGTERKGSGASVSVLPHAPLKFGSATSKANVADPNNNVRDLAAVTADEVNAALVAAGIAARAAQSPTTGRLVLATTATGPAAALAIRGGDGSSHGALGLTQGQSASGVAGNIVSFYVKRGGGWTDQANATLAIGGLDPTDAPAGGAEFLTMLITARDRDGHQTTYEDVGFDDSHPRGIRHVLALTPSRRADALENLFAFEIGANVDPFELRAGLFTTGSGRIVTLSGGSDGASPGPVAYEKAFAVLERIEDISIVAAPGHSSYDTTSYQGIQSALISHSERLRAYRISVLDTPADQTIGQAQQVRARMDSKYAALYYPWVVVPNPLYTQGSDNIPREIPLPPSGFVCGIYARNDVERGVHKAPANEVVRGALRFEIDVNFAQQEMLNPVGVNCLRFFPGRGFRVWGATHRQLGSGMEVRERAPLLQLPGALDRPRHAVGGLRAQRRAPVGERPRNDHELPATTMVQRGAARRQPERGLLRALRPQHDDPERSRQRPPGLPDRRRGAEAGRVRDLPHRPEDGRLAQLTTKGMIHGRTAQRLTVHSTS